MKRTFSDYKHCILVQLGGREVNGIFPLFMLIGTFVTALPEHNLNSWFV